MSAAAEPDRIPGTSPSLEGEEMQAPRYQRIRQWQSRLLPTPRDLFIYLPEAYLHEPTRSFPVMLMHDGQNLFDGQISYVKGSTWRAGVALDEAIASGEMRPAILVGIANTGVERMSEYTPVSDPRLGGGRGPLYARMLVEHLLPELRSRFRILPGPGNTAITGSSLGGLISLWIALTYPQIFGGAGVLSPSIWWANRSILQTVSSLRSRPDVRIWLDMGSAEGAPHVRDTEAMFRLLERKGWQLDRDLAFRIVPGGVHSEEAWSSRFGEVLRFLFPPVSAPRG